MSPRSEEFLTSAAERLRLAQLALSAGMPASAVSAAYYAALYAARAALSEDDVAARTHRGTWMQFRERFVLDGRVDEALYRDVVRAQALREQADYDAVAVEGEVAAELIEVAERFVSAVRAALADAA